MRIEVQNKILELCKSGTFSVIEYIKTTHEAVKAVPTFDTSSSDASPANLQGTVTWNDSRALQNDKRVYYDASSTYAIWTSTTHGEILSAISDVGNEAVADYFSLQDYPDTISARGAGTVDFNRTLEFTSIDGNGYPQYEYTGVGPNLDLLFNSPYWEFFNIADYGYRALDSGKAPPKTGYEKTGVAADPAPTLAYTLPTTQFIGQGAWTGTIIIPTGSERPVTTEVPKVVVNEISSVPSKSTAHGSRSGDMGLSNWRFEAHLKFTNEVDTYEFLTTQLKPISFVHDNIRIRIGSIGSPVGHPPRQGSHNGTEMLITFSVNTRR